MSQREPERSAALVAGVYFCAAPGCVGRRGTRQELASRDRPAIVLKRARRAHHRQSLRWSPEVIRLTCPQCGAWNRLEQP